MSTAAARQRMVNEQLLGRDITDQTVLDAMTTVPREHFVPEKLVSSAYLDRPLPIGQGQTISQPYIVASTLQALELKAGQTVLEIGGGSGYAAAVAAVIVERVISLERLEPLCEQARRNLDRAGIGNVDIHCSDGSLGWPESAPYERIMAAAAAEDVPQPLLDQLSVNGLMIIPVGRRLGVQQLLRIQRRGEDDYQRESLSSVRFVPLLSGTD